MKRIFRGLAVAGVAISLTSCGYIGPLTRSATSLIDNFGDLATTAASSGAF
jgi:hypothetical protein